jgi:hypothetical protein
MIPAAVPRRYTLPPPPPALVRQLEVEARRLVELGSQQPEAFAALLVRANAGRLSGYCEVVEMRRALERGGDEQHRPSTLQRLKGEVPEARKHGRARKASEQVAHSHLRKTSSTSQARILSRLKRTPGDWHEIDNRSGDKRRRGAQR